MNLTSPIILGLGQQQQLFRFWVCRGVWGWRTSFGGGGCHHALWCAAVNHPLPQGD